LVSLMNLASPNILTEKYLSALRISKIVHFKWASGLFSKNSQGYRISETIGNNEAFDSEISPLLTSADANRDRLSTP
jgi:hypothetical protein